MASQLDDEITSLQERVHALRKELKLQATALISAPSTQQILSAPASAALTLPGDSNPVRQRVLARSAAQAAHNQQCLYRTCAGVTTFRVRDPDPRAVDGGRVLGVRIEVVGQSARFLRPYYVLLNRPYASAPAALRIHRHTVPPCIPIAGLAARNLPAPPARTDEGDGGADVTDKKTGGRQDLSWFVRALRREIVRYHNRLAMIGVLRKVAGLDDDRRRKSRRRSARRSQQDTGDDNAAEGLFLDISAADAEAKQITISWADGRTGRVVMGDDGQILQLVVFGDHGRDRGAARELLGAGCGIEDLAKKLSAPV